MKNVDPYDHYAACWVTLTSVLYQLKKIYQYENDKGSSINLQKHQRRRACVGGGGVKVLV